MPRMREVFLRSGSALPIVLMLSAGRAAAADYTGTLTAPVQTSDYGVTSSASGTIDLSNSNGGSIRALISQYRGYLYSAGNTSLVMTGGTISTTLVSPLTSDAVYAAVTQNNDGVTHTGTDYQVGGPTDVLTTTISQTSLTMTNTQATPVFSPTLWINLSGGSAGDSPNDSGKEAGLAGGHAGGDTFTADDATFAGTVSQASREGGVITVTESGGDGGDAGTGDRSSATPVYGGTGGGAAAVTFTFTDTTVTANGNDLSALYATVQGGNGGNGGAGNDEEDWSFGGAGGPTGVLSVTLPTNSTNSFTTVGNSARGIYLLSAAGDGGTGAETGGLFQDGVSAGDGGNGGDTNTLTIDNEGALTITTQGARSAAIEVETSGGTGGDGGQLDGGDFSGSAGKGGNGGSGELVTVTLNGSGILTTQGTLSPAVYARSLGGDAGDGGDGNRSSVNPDGGYGGNGGSTGGVIVTLGAGMYINTLAEESPGIIALSRAGFGGRGGNGGTGDDGEPAGSGGNAGGIQVTIDGHVTTQANYSPAVLLQAISGTGGAGGDSSAYFTGDPGGPGDPGTVGDIVVTNTGSVQTLGVYSDGIVAQSLGGGGGAGGSSSAFFYAPGAGAANGTDGGTVTVTSTGSIATSYESSSGIVAQSIGGGGGIGGAGSAVALATGGNGGNGGDGGAVTLTLGGLIQTGGALSMGAVAQSIGGVGGTGGNAYAASTLPAYAVGGDGGSGGNGGSVTIDPTDLRLWTTGDGGIGLLGQSIGGGGGSGGAAYASSAGAFFAYAVALGGQGGNGGDGASVTETLDGTSITTGEAKNGTVTSSYDAYGVVAQSLGGGGGTGGGASAEAFTQSISLNDTADSNGKVWWETDSLPSVSAALQIGGRDGTAGNGGTVSVTMQGGTQVMTTGDGSTGVIAQSVGAGGGSGGDSSLLRALLTQLGAHPLSSVLSKADIDIDTTVGSYHDTASTGAQATVTLGDGTGGAGANTVTTSGDYATGLLVQSIGGGGGVAGIGSSQVYNIASSLTLKLLTNVGAQGGGGGNGGEADAILDTDSAVTTQGAGAPGVVVQSIGGGGGIASGGSVRIGGNDNGSSLFGGLDTGGNSGASLTTTLIWAQALGTVATEGGSSFSAAVGAGAAAKATLAGSVTTAGDDSPAVLMQSIGGGGGILGSSSAGANDDDVEEAATASSYPSLTVEINRHIGVGGQIRVADKTGSGENGGAVTVDTLSGTLTTSGDNAPALQMQSIGAGGGRAGTAITLTNTDAASFSNVTFENANYGYSPQGDNNRLSLGASSGLSGYGGTVQATFSNVTIQTGAGKGSAASTGYQSFGVLMQSIGGGGGSITDGSNIVTDETLGVGGGTDFNYDQGLSQVVQVTGNGGDVNFFGASDNQASSVSTTGDGADGVVLQSIGGGGGVASNVQPDARGADSAVTNIILGGYGAVGNGQAVTIGAADGGKAQLSVTTTGDRAYGILAQSIGGGGGLVNYGTKNVLLTQIGQTKPSADNGSDDLGGTVSLNLAAGSTISTSGTASFGVVAQSIGGGGGLITTTYDHDATPGFSNATPASSDGSFPRGGDGYGNGGAVTILSDADVSVSGAGSIGIVGQSIGGGGGIVDTGSTIYFTAMGSSANASSGAVTMTLTHTIQAEGENSIGVLAQGMGSNAGQDSQITLTLGDESGGTSGTVIGGSGDGVGVLIYGGSETNQLTISSGSSIAAASGTAIRQSGDGLLSVTNNGTITGSTYLNGGLISGTGTTSAAVVAGPLSQATVAPSSALLVNNGTLIAPAGQTSVIDGTLEQTASGRIVTTADFANASSSGYRVTGDAVLAGALVPTLRSVVAGVRVPVLTVEGTRTGTLSVPDSALFSFGLVRSGRTDELEVADTHFSAPALGLTGEQTAVAGGLTDLFDAGETRLGSFFADLDGVAEASTAAYRAQLSQLAPRTALRMEAQLAEQATAVADDAMTCPSRSPSGGAADFLTEGSCIFARGGAQRTSIGAEGARASSDLTSAGYEIGGQQVIHPGLTVGAVAGYQQSWFGARDGSKGGGTGGQAAVTIKYQPGPWLFTGAIFGSVGDYHVQRTVNVPDFAGVTHGRFTQGAIGGRVRAAYTLGTERLYLRPYLNVDGVYAARGAYQETGLRALGLMFGHADQATAILTPAVEVGGRVRLAPRTALRAFGSLGASVRTNDSWGADARLVGFERASRRFTTTLPQDRALARVSAGFQLFQGAGVDVRVQYDGAYGGVSQSSGGSARLVYSF